MSWLVTAARRFGGQQHAAWFGAADARALAVCRILIFWHVWPGFRVRDYTAYADFVSSAWFPVSFFKAWSVPVLGATGLHVASVALVVASFLALVGAAYPVAAPVAALLTLYLRGLPHNFGKVNHSENLLVLAVLLFAFARAADAWSVDAWLKRRFRGRPAAAASGRYRWPVRFIALLVVTMYGAAGVSKLINSGWEWALSDSFRWLLLRHHFTHAPPTRLGVWIAEFPELCQGLALAALLLELACPLALLSKWLFRLLIPALVSLQVGIWLLLGVRFQAMLPLFLCLLPWQAALVYGDRAWAKLRAVVRLRPTAPEAP